jgi:hypothetical protein
MSYLLARALQPEERTQIELGVDLGGVKRLMAEYIGYLFKRTASNDHMRR